VIAAQERPKLILLHGWAMHSEMWGDFASQLSQHYCVTLMDLPLRDNLNDIADAIVAQLNDEPFYILGWSFGGTVALKIAERFPNRVQGLILLAANPCFVTKENWFGMNPEAFNAFSDNFHTNPAATLQRFLGLQLQGSPTFLKEVKRRFSLKPLPEFSELETSLALLQMSDLRPILKKLTCLITAILSDNDALIPVSCGEQMQTLQPNLQLTILKNATHIPFVTQPENCLNAILNAIR
jgi:pimeloyl-[acyl-carrier protein] methyl ester esterase